jgi:hypothetical protein
MAEVSFNQHSHQEASAQPPIGAVSAKLGELDPQVFKRLGTCALALIHARGEYIAPSTPPDELLACNKQGKTRRDLPHSDATALAQRGLMNGARLGGHKVMLDYQARRRRAPRRLRLCHCRRRSRSMRRRLRCLRRALRTVCPAVLRS